MGASKKPSFARSKIRRKDTRSHVSMAKVQALALPIFGKPVSGLSFVLKYAVSRLRARISLESCLRIME